MELYLFVLPLFCVLVNSFVSPIELPGCCVVSELVLYELVSSGSFWGCVKSELAKLVSLELPIEVEACSEVEPNSLLELSLDSILDVDSNSGLNLFVVDSTVFSDVEIVDDGIVEDSFVSPIELPGCCVVSELVLYELVSSGSFWGCVKSELAKLVFHFQVVLNLNLQN